MKISKKVLCDLDHCYAVSIVGERQDILFASEAEGPCIGFNSQGENPFTVWDGPSGTMNIVGIPGSESDFLAVQNFFPVFRSADAKLVWVHRKDDGAFVVHPFVDIPYLHRFDLLQQGNTIYLIACTLCGSKQFVDDWSDPGKVYVGVMPTTPVDGIRLEPVLEGLTHNHGYCRGVLDGKVTSLITSDEGVFVLRPPQSLGGDWETDQLLHTPVGDIAMVDIDGDGATELVAIEPFHGTDLVVYHKGSTGYEVRYRHQPQMEFGHTLWGGDLLGKPAILCGSRGGSMELFCLQYVDGRYRKELIDEGKGPSNMAVLHHEGIDIICVANRQVGQATIYLLQP